MSFSSWLRNWKRSLERRSALHHSSRRKSAARGVARKTDGVRPRLEVLEDRLAPATLTVNTAADVVNPSDGTLSLRDAISAINAGNANGLTAVEQGQVSGTFGNNDTIQFQLSNGSIINLNSALPNITKNVTISGLGENYLTISGQHQSGILSIAAGAKVGITGLTLEDGNAGSGNGGGIDNTSGTVTVSNCALSGNSATYGGGIYNFRGTLTVNASILSGNTAAKEGGGIFNEGFSLTVNKSTLSGNTATTGDGGGIEDLGGYLTLSHSIINAQNKAGGNGGGIAIENYNTGIVNNCTISGNLAGGSGGGGIFCGSSTLTVNSSKIQDNNTQQLGGGIYDGGDVTVSNSTIQGNTAAGVGNGTDGGGGIENLSRLTVNDSTITGNSATTGNGGAIANNGLSLIVTNSTFSENSAGGFGSGIFGGNSTITSSTFTGNSGSGDVLFNTGANTLTVSDCTISDNSDGGIGTWASLVVSNCVISGNTLGGIGTDGGTVTISDSTISNNSGSTFDSSGITNVGVGTVTVSGCVVSGNSGNTGGIENGGTMTVTDTSIYDNTAISGNGGGIYNDGTLTVSDSAIYDNFGVGSEGWGGGILNNGNATLSVINSTITGNSAGPAGGGGGIANFGTLTATNCTIADNSASGGGGIAVENNGVSPTVLYNTIVADNTSGGDLFVNGGSYSGSNDLIGDGSYLSSFSNSLSGPALLAPLGNYGGPAVGDPGGVLVGSPNDGTQQTQPNAAQSMETMALLPGSPAIGGGIAPTTLTAAVAATDTTITVADPSLLGLIPGTSVLLIDSEQLLVTAVNGDTLSVSRGYNSTTAATHNSGAGIYNAFDQRGQPRLYNGALDIGAFESQGFTITASSGRVQSTDVNTNFPNPLTVTVTANYPLEPVSGGMVTFTAPASGASATLSASTAVIGSNGTASVTATANGTAGGPYTVTAAANGITNTASFYLTNSVGPTSLVSPLGLRQSSDTFTVPFTFSDGAGVASVDLYYSNDRGTTWTLYQNLSASGATSGTLNFSFNGQDRNTYDFYSIAHSVSGAVQSTPANRIEASTRVPDLNPPVTHALAANPGYSWAPFPSSEFSGLTASSYNSGNGTFTITWAGADPDANSGTPPGSIAAVGVFVSVDGGAYQQIGPAQNAGSPNANGVYSGSLTYNALADGQPHTYSFDTLGIDDWDVTQAVPAAPDVTFSNISYTAPLAVSAFNVVHSETQNTPLTERSFIRYLEVDFNQSPTVNAPNFLSNLSTYVELLYFGTNGTVQGSVSLSNVAATLSGSSLFLDFGANGLTSALTLTGGQTAPSNPTSSTFGDGWYALGISSKATGSGSPIWVPFFRLLGSATGDTTVTGTTTGADYQLVNGAVGKTPINYNADLNGDGSVNLTDVKLVKTSNAHTAGNEPTSFPQFQLFAGPASPGQAAPISEATVAALIPEAINAWKAAGLDAADVQLMTQAPVQVAALNGNILGLEQGGAIWINDTAAGYGWYVTGKSAASEVDLLTVLEHELGHIVGLPDNALPGDLMNTSLGLGMRRTPTAADVSQLAGSTNATGSQPIGHAGSAGSGLTVAASSLPFLGISMGTVANSGKDVGLREVDDALFSLLGQLAAVDSVWESDLLRLIGAVENVLNMPMARV
jgi:hypothetical protein